MGILRAHVDQQSSLACRQAGSSSRWLQPIEAPLPMRRAAKLGGSAGISPRRLKHGHIGGQLHAHHAASGRFWALRVRRGSRWLGRRSRNGPAVATRFTILVVQVDESRQLDEHQRANRRIPFWLGRQLGA